MKNIIRWFAPKKQKLFEMFAEQSQNALECSKELKSFVDNYEKFERSERKNKANGIKNIKQRSNDTTRNIIERLTKNSIKPIDKEDLHQMAVLLNDITGSIASVASRFVLLGIERIDNHLIRLVDLIISAVSELDKSILNLKKLKGMDEHCAKIHKLENEAEDAYHEALSDLFHFYKNSIDIIKYKEIYELLENITGKCKDAADVIEAIVIKHS